MEDKRQKGKDKGQKGKDKIQKGKDKIQKGKDKIQKGKGEITNQITTNRTMKGEQYLRDQEQPSIFKAKDTVLQSFILFFSLFLFSTLTPGTLYSQDAEYTQYYNNPTYYNPAAVGLTLGLKTRLNYRKQWTGLSGDYHTYSFSADIADRSLPGAGGIGVIASQSLAGQGILKTNTIGFMPSVRIPISKSTIFQLGALASVVTQQLNWDNLIFGDQLDPVFGNIGPSSFTGASRDKVIFPDFAFGGIFQFQGYNVEGSIGGAVHHITQPNQSFFDVNAKLPRKYVMNIDLVININENQGYYSKRQGFKLNPGFMVEDQAGMLLYRLGMNIYMSHIYLGIWYKNETLEYDQYSNFTGMVGINIPMGNGTRMKLTYSYEMNVTSQHNFTGPSHELSLIFEFDNIRLIGKGQNSGFTIPTQRHSNSPIECSPF